MRRAQTALLLLGAQNRCYATTTRRRAQLRSLGRRASLEISPHQVEDLVGARDHLAIPKTIFVNMVQADAAHFEAVAAACEALRAAGLEAVPHVPASRFDDDAHAGRVLDELSAAGATSALVVAGNDFDGSAPDVDAVAALARKRGFRCFFAGFPEGHPHDSSGGARLAAKLAPASAGVVTQFVRDPAVLGEWLDGARPAAETVFVGVPGPATRRRLAQMAGVCGVGPSVYVDAYDVDDDDGDDALLAPAADVGALADYLGSSEGNVRLHVYPFGGLDAALVFLDALASKGILWEPGGFGAGG